MLSLNANNKQVGRTQKSYNDLCGKKGNVRSGME